MTDATEFRKITAHLKTLRAYIEASAMPTGCRPLPDHDNHHNALKCPYCNPDDMVLVKREQASAIPDGHVVVPVEPTKKMLEHAHTAVVTANTFVIGKFDNYETQERVLMAAMYRAMIAARPHPAKDAQPQPKKEIKP